MAGTWKDRRPMSPHLQIWKWHPTMMSSILHRACAIICYVALVLLAVGVVVLATTGGLPLEGLLFGPLGAIGLFVFVFAFLFMAFAQLRHAVWDNGAMFEPGFNNMLSWVMILGAVVGAAIVTFFATGAV